MNEDRAADPWAFCNHILVDVSRSFALIIPRCPPPIDKCLCVGYLLCRIADTIEDDENLAISQREILYDQLLGCVDNPSAIQSEHFIHSWPEIPASHYGTLIQGTHQVLRAFESIPSDYRGPIIQCVHDMVAGMRCMKPIATKGAIAFYCRDLTDLDRYCHHVAGTVGLMSTSLFEQYFHEHRCIWDSTISADAWREQGRRMGLGLQMTNIIKDSCVDADRGVSFIPIQYLDQPSCELESKPSARSQENLTPKLTQTGRAELIRHTLDHLDEAIAYTMAIPSNEIGIRTFLLGSILPAVATLEVAALVQHAFPKIERGAMANLLKEVEQSAEDNDRVLSLYREWRDRCVHSLSASEGKR